MRKPFLTSAEIELLVEHYHREMIRWDPAENAQQIEDARRSKRHWQEALALVNHGFADAIR